MKSTTNKYRTENSMKSTHNGQFSFSWIYCLTFKTKRKERKQKLAMLKRERNIPVSLWFTNSSLPPKNLSIQRNPIDMSFSFSPTNCLLLWRKDIWKYRNKRLDFCTSNFYFSKRENLEKGMSVVKKNR